MLPFSSPVPAPGSRAALRELVAVFVAEKTWEGCGGLTLADEIRVTIAGHACLLLLLPLQILFLNLVTDVFPALALGVGREDPGVLRQPPRPTSEPVLPRRLWLGVGAYGCAIAAAVLGAMAFALLGLGLDRAQAVTVSFLTLAFAQLWHVFNMASPGAGPLRNDITANPFVWGAVALCTALLVAAVYLPGLARVLETADPGAEGWLLVLAMSLVPLVAGQAARWVGARASR